MTTPLVQKPVFEGVWPILVTPFDGQETLDLPALETIVRFMGTLGVEGITVLGVLGEVNRLTDSERERVVQTAVRAAGALPVCVGTTHPGTAACRNQSLRAQDQGAAAVMISPSQESAPNEERILEFYTRATQGLSIPVVVQDHPASSHTFMSTALLLRLAQEVPGVACIKEEQPPTPSKVAALLAGLQGRPATASITLLQGLGALYGMFDLERGAHGFMTGFAFPELLQRLVRAFRSGRTEEAWALYTRFLPLIVFEQQPGLAVRKEIYRRRGLIGESTVRHPGGSLDAGTAGQLDALLTRILPGADLTRPLAL